MWLAPIALLAGSSGWSVGTVLAWSVGLVCGIVIMVGLSTDWERLPAFLGDVARTLRQQAGWAALAAGSLAVIVLY